MLDEFVKGWKVELVRHKFVDDKANLIWEFEKNGKYSIVSAYHME